jgi:hypothetical protein
VQTGTHIEAQLSQGKIVCMVEELHPNETLSVKSKIEIKPPERKNEK